MAEPIGPGDWVECIDDSAPYSPYYRLKGPFPWAKGAVLQVRAVGEMQSDGHPSLAITQDTNPFRTWSAARFRPIYRPTAGAFDSLLVSDEERVSA